MLHLLSERLAGLADDEPTIAEAMHLAKCSQCAAARRFHQELLAATRKHGERELAPLTSWETLSPKLAAAGLIVAPRAKPRVASHIARRLALIAASLALVVGGTAAGRVSAGASVLPGSLLTGTGSAQVAANDAAEFSSTAEALNVFLSSQREYQRAAAYLAANDSSPRESQQTMLTRLAALEEMHTSLLAGLREAPTDPVLNNSYVQTLNARNATRQQISQFVPVSGRVRGY